MKIDVCVISYRRPKGLQRLLGALQRLERPAPDCQLRVVVVDNDPEGSAREVCAAAAGWLDLPVHYRQEKRRGIPQARNAALAEALDHAEWVAFVDDDAEPEPAWLAELCRVRERTGADAVTGPCLSVFEAQPPGWVARSGCFDRPRHADGERIAYARTGNVLVATAALARMERLFDERMALSGSSDTELFRRFVAEGHSIVWADGARVREWVPASRATLGWLLRRGFRVGNAESFMQRAIEAPPRPAGRVLAHGLWCVLKGGGQALLGLPRGLAGAAPGLRLAAVGLGRLSGLAGHRYEEYRTIHGR